MRHVLTRSAVALVTSLLLLAVLEGGSYLFGRFPGPQQPLRVGSIQFLGRHDPLLFWSLEPGARAPDGTRWINSLGLRGPEPRTADEDAFRILSLGESSTFGAQVPVGSTYSAVLERELARRPGAGPVRVLNGGVPGYSLFQGVQYLLHRSAALEPDLVLLYFGFNDFLPVAYLAERVGAETGAGYSDWELFRKRREPLQRLRSSLIGASNLARAILGGPLPRAELPSEPLVLEGKPRVPAADRERLLDLAAAYAREHGLELVLVVPVYREFTEHAELLRRVAAREGLVLVDLPALLPDLAGGGPEPFLDAVHPTAATHARIAGAIAGVVGPLVP